MTPETPETRNPKEVYEDYQISQELRHQQRRMAAEGMADIMIGAMGDRLDADKKEMFRSAWVEMMEPTPEPMPPAQLVVPDIKPMPPSTFEEETESAYMFYDWHCLLQRSSHFMKSKITGAYVLLKGQEIVLEIPAGKAAKSFEAYATWAKSRYAAPGMFR